jgi:hypothetical protein
MIKLGTRVRDTITGFEGIAVARTVWLYGCSRIAVQSSELHDGKPIEAQWIDEEQLIGCIGAQEVEPMQASTGGSRIAPTRAQDPTR